MSLSRRISCLFAMSFIVSLAFFPAGLWATEKLTEKPDAITIGFIPGEDPQELQKHALALAKDLQKRLGLHVDVYISKNYQGLSEAMRDGKVDFAFFSATTFVMSEKLAQAKVLLKKVWQGPYYYSSIITLKKSKLNRIEDLKGKSIAYVDEKSGSGYLYPQLLLKKKKINPEQFFSKKVFAGNHSAAVKMLLDGQVDAAAVFSDNVKATSGAWNKFFPDSVNKVKVIWNSEPIPNDPFCVRQSFYDKYPKVAHELMFALIDYKDEPDDKNLMNSLFGVKELTLATSRQYDPVRELVKELNLKLQ